MSAGSGRWLASLGRGIRRSGLARALWGQPFRASGPSISGCAAAGPGQDLQVRRGVDWRTPEADIQFGWSGAAENIRAQRKSLGKRLLGSRNEENPWITSRHLGDKGENGAIASADTHQSFEQGPCMVPAGDATGIVGTQAGRCGRPSVARAIQQRHIPLLSCGCNMTYQRHHFGFQRSGCPEGPYPEQACCWERETPLSPLGRGAAGSFVDICDGHLP